MLDILLIRSKVTTITSQINILLRDFVCLTSKVSHVVILQNISQKRLTVNSFPFLKTVFLPYYLSWGKGNQALGLWYYYTYLFWYMYFLLHIWTWIKLLLMFKLKHWYVRTYCLWVHLGSLLAFSNHRFSLRHPRRGKIYCMNINIRPNKFHIASS